MTRHELKLWSDHFQAMKAGLKRADVRRCDDRQFRRGDEVLYRDFTARTEKYSGEALIVHVTHLTRAAGHLDLYGVQEEGRTDDGMMFPIVVLSIEVLEIGTYEALRQTLPSNAPATREPNPSVRRAGDPPDRFVNEPCGHRSPQSVYFCDRERGHAGEHFHGGRIAGPDPRRRPQRETMTGATVPAQEASDPGNPVLQAADAFNRRALDLVCECGHRNGEHLGRAGLGPCEHTTGDKLDPFCHCEGFASTPPARGGR